MIPSECACARATAKEAVAGRLADVGMEDLDGDVALVPDVAREIDGRGMTVTDLANQLIAVLEARDQRGWYG